MSDRRPADEQTGESSHSNASVGALRSRCVHVCLCALQLLASLSSLLLVSVHAQSSTGTSSSSSGGAVVLPAFDTFASSYEIDWSSIYAATPTAALSIPENTELGPCICDLTFNKCDANCKCDAVWLVESNQRARGSVLEFISGRRIRSADLTCVLLLLPRALPCVCSPRL